MNVDLRLEGTLVPDINDFRHAKGLSHGGGTGLGDLVDATENKLEQV